MGFHPGREAAVGRSLSVGYLVVLAILVASAALSILNGEVVLRDGAWVVHSHQVLQQQAEVSADVAFMESAARGFLASGNPEFEAEFKDSEVQLAVSSAGLEALTIDNPAQRNDLSLLKSMTAQRESVLQNAILRHKQNMPPAPASNPRSAVVLDAKQKIFQVLNGVRDRERLLIEDRTEQADSSVKWAYFGLWSSSLIGCIALTGFFGIVKRYVDTQRALRRDEQSRASELEDRVRERTTELSQANKDLEAFSYSVSHDLRAPLRAMHGYAAILKQESGSRLSRDDIGMLDRIQINCSKMSELTESLLALFRVGKTDLMIEDVNLSALAAEVVQDLRLDYPGVDFEIDIEPEMNARGDRQMLRALLVNLIGNAMKFSSKTRRPCISFELRASEGEKVFAVEDNGAGFDPSHAGLLFEPFQRLHTDREFSGNGIGLAMCRKIVSRHKGNIWLESELGKGTTAFFRLGLGQEARETTDPRGKAVIL
jgi:signal transduction histidine kinase